MSLVLKEHSILVSTIIEVYKEINLTILWFLTFITLISNLKKKNTYMKIKSQLLRKPLSIFFVNNTTS